MRVLKVKGVKDRLVSNPHSANAIRFVGKAWNDKSDPSLPHPQRWDNVEESIADHLDLRNAVKKGDLSACDEATAARCGLKPAEKSAHKDGK